MSKKIKLFACCIPVKGATKSIICDLQRSDYDEIPNTLFDLLTTHDGSSIDDIKACYPKEEHEIIDEYISFLQENEYIFFTDTPEDFPAIQLQWDSPQWVTNAVLDFDKHSAYDISGVITQLSTLRCNALELRFFDSVPFSFIEYLLLQTQHSSLRSVSVIICYNEASDIFAIKKLFLLPAPITNVLIHNYNGEEFSRLLNNVELPIFTTPSRIHDETHCGIISPYSFAVNIQLFTEAQQFNSCLNRKISVDRYGSIKNCPSCDSVYGHIANTLLSTVLDNPTFRQVWTVKKDDILVCKDCEYRYICVDCRAYQQGGNLEKGKPVKCKYDPYTGTYAEE